VPQRLRCNQFRQDRPKPTSPNWNSRFLSVSWCMFQVSGVKPPPTGVGENAAGGSSHSHPQGVSRAWPVAGPFTPSSKSTVAFKPYAANQKRRPSMADLSFATQPHVASPDLHTAFRSCRTLLALDLGTTTGWALHGPDGLITSGTVSFRPGRFDGGGMRYLRFSNWLGELDRLSGPIASIWFEEVRRHAATDAAHVYGGLMATLTAWMRRHEAVARHVAGRVRRQRDRRLRRRGRHADPDLPGLRAAHDAGAEPEDRRGLHRGERRAVLPSAAGV